MRKCPALAAAVAACDSGEKRGAFLTWHQLPCTASNVRLLHNMSAGAIISSSARAKFA